MLAWARTGRSASLLLVGEPGLGKTALLDWAAEQAVAAGMRVVRLVAVEAESAITAAGTGLLLRLLDADPADTAVHAVLDALVAASREQPLLVTVDDAQWLDVATRQALGFAARRLLADPVAMVLSSRPGDLGSLEAFPATEVPPLDREASRELLRARFPAMTTTRADEVADALGHVPLPLVEVGRLLTEDELLGRDPLPEPLPVSDAVQSRYAQGFASLEEPARRLLVLLAADDGTDPTLVSEARERLGLGAGLWERAESTGLVRLGAVPQFVHPLARASVHSAADPAQRRAAHAALGEVLRARDEEELAVRHLALAATGPDEHLAEALVRLAEVAAAERPGPSAAALALAGARLASGPAQRDRLRVLAAECSVGLRAVELAEQVQASTQEPVLLARCVMVRVDADERADPAQLVELTRQLDHLDLPEPLALRSSVASVWAAIHASDVARLEELAVGAEAERLGGSSWLATAALGMAFTFLGRHHRGVPLLREAQARSADVDPASLPPERAVDWATVAGWLGDDAEHDRRMRSLDRALRASGQPELVAVAAFFSAERDRREGDWARAEAMLAEAIELRTATGEPSGVEWSRLASLLACQGHEVRVEQAVEAARDDFARRGASPWQQDWVSEARGVLALGLGRLEEAAELLAPLATRPYVGRGARDAVALGLADLAEVRAALGRVAEARQAAEDLARRLHGVHDPQGTALVHRARAVSGLGDADTEYAQALERFAETQEVFETARTELLLGEHLRRTQRPSRARDPLRRALEGFERTRTQPWVERARRELAAAGGRPAAGAAGRDGPSRDRVLTPQELRVALAVTEGGTNAEVAAALFVSVKTVEYHLGNVFRKLAVRSRGGLAVALRREGLLGGDATAPA